MLAVVMRIPSEHKVTFDSCAAQFLSCRSKYVYFPLEHRKWAKTTSLGWPFKDLRYFSCFEPFKLLSLWQLIGLTKTKEHNEKEASRYTYVVLDTRKL